MAWRASLLVKGLKVNAGKMKLIVRGGGIVVSDHGAWPCGVRSKGVAADTLQCTPVHNE